MESLASKYRPKTFPEVVGQGNIIQILSNQILHESIKQAYLFTGGAGTGKTTTARLFGRAINEGRGELIEIDGASNNGVENVRELRESCKFRPLDSKYKVYIIDEVHMLSIGAFNALLKTLEEPPPHAIFLLCTTDPQKIPATILSRVQRFDFKRIQVEQILKRLNFITREEKKNVSADALEYIAKLSNGGMRDAISLLDTCLGYKDDLLLSDIFEILGATDYESFCVLTSAIINNDYSAIIELIEGLHLKGKDLKQFVKGYIEFIVDLRKVQLLSNFNYIMAPSLYHDSIRNLIDQLEYVSADLNDWFRKLTDLSNRIRYESSPKILIEGELLCL